MDEEETQLQKELHDSIEETLREQGDLPEGHMLTGWVVCFETASMRDMESFAGHLYGPREMTSWRALGLIEWVRRFSIMPGSSREDEDEDD